MSDYLQKETVLLETLMSALDAREGARQAGSPLLVYLSDMLVQRTREELGDPADPKAARAAVKAGI